MKKSFLIVLVLLLAIMSFSFIVRQHTFKLPHDNGDQLMYAGLAMTLDAFGFEGYNLHKIQINKNDFIMHLFPSKLSTGNLLRGLVKSGATYYDQPMFHRPYAFAYALKFSHNLFAKDKPYILLNTSARDKAGRVFVKNVDSVWFSQFYAAFVPFVFSLLFIFTTYLFARRFFSEKIALIASFLIAISPIEILCSQKIWADTMLSFFVLLTVFLFFLAKEKKSLLISFLSGLSCGIAILVKQSGGFIVIVIILFHLWQHRSNILNPRMLPKILFDRYLLMFGFGALFASFHWFYVVTKTYGNPLFNPARAQAAQLRSQVGWFSLLKQRPRFLFLVTIPYLVPVFALAYFAVLVEPFVNKFKNEKMYFLIFWVLTFLGILLYLGSRENRYMLPAYPAIAILSAGILVKIADVISRKSKDYYGTCFILVVLLACAVWSIPIGLKHAFSNVALILKPF